MDPVLLREALLAHDVYVCLERPSGTLPLEASSLGFLVRGIGLRVSGSGFRVTGARLRVLGSECQASTF